ncbi:MAG TPA: DUF222 domain-containing protein [Actinomycetota bacterium]|nr:DUF222 domain-containing protein [Actinomycetota bacterium]
MGGVGSLEEVDRAAAAFGKAARELLRAIERAARDRRIDPRALGARDLAHLLQIRLGIPAWKARRYVHAARALERLPLTSEALERGELSLEKAVELARFATPEDEARLLRWARGVAPWAVRRRADLAGEPRVRTDREVHASRRLDWWWSEEDRSWEFFCRLPLAEGFVVKRAVERLAERLPVLPGDGEPFRRQARNADALVALARASLAGDPDPDRATVVVHAPWGSLAGGRRYAELEDGLPLHPETARRLTCDARVQLLLEDEAGNVLYASRTRRHPPAWMLRQLLHRDRGCRFPGCGSRAFPVAHHLRHWCEGGETTLENLALLCSFHHRLVHEEGWRLWRDAEGGLGWATPDGRPYDPRPGPSPPAPAAPAPRALVPA